MKFQSRKLGDFCQTGSGGTPSRSKSEYFLNGIIPWIKSGELKNRYVTEVEEYITELAVKNSSAKLVKSGSLLIAMYGATVGEVSQLTFDATTNQAICNIYPDPMICDINYLYRYLEASKEYLLSRRVGGGQPNISQGLLKDLDIPLPPLPEQRRIAAILDKADALRQKRKQAIAKLDQLLQATFIEMFGDPVTNPKGWELFELSHLGNISTGNTPPRSVAENYGNYIEWIKSDNLNNTEDYATISTEYLSEKGAKKGRIVQAGSILVTCIAGSFNCIGNLAMVERQVSFNQQINAITPNETVYLEFLYYLMKISKPIIQDASTNSMKGMISKSKFGGILLPIPPKDKQNKFIVLFKKNLPFKRET